ncbi:AcrR family transcriptional regulator [Rhodococcus sp. 27YEA15]|uniref:hypothetical protein n=1 Tax=Rhodococcus sp. 27YEA15 TaxID=3156259 RepID=UPI003C7AD0D1
MEPQPESRPRGRPRKITREAIAEAGRRLTLPRVTVADVADELGVGIRSLYKHTSGIADIQVITAEEIFAGWQAPSVEDVALDAYLLEVAVSLRRLAKENAGIAGFLVRNSQDISPRVLKVMDAHHQAVAEAYDLPLPQASLLLSAVAEHALSVTDVVHSHGGRARDYERMARNTELPALSAAARETRHHDDDNFFLFATRALIIGLLALINEIVADGKEATES